MKTGFYPKLAWQGIRKNRRLYLPNLFSCIGMVTVFYMIASLADSPLVHSISGGRTLCSILEFGYQVMAIFSALLMFYANGFLLRRRKREFGLYNILGMGKWNIGRILFWEYIIMALISLAAGLGIGMGLAKLFELGLMHMVGGTITYDLTVSVMALIQSVTIFGGIFVLLFLHALFQIHVSKPVELMHSEQAGEKPPKANRLLGILGAVLLAGAYFIAVSIQNPIDTIGWFFIAVIMVIVATYLLFISGSVVLCRFLQKCKGYYYKANHFVSVSSMAFRMKRNGAGLASICILLTMAMVTISSTTSLFAGIEDSAELESERDFSLRLHYEDAQSIAPEHTAQVQSRLEELMGQQRLEPKDLWAYPSFRAYGYLENGQAELKNDYYETFLEDHPGCPFVQMYVLSLSDYNRLSGAQETLEPDQVLLASTAGYDWADITLGSSSPLRVKSVVRDSVFLPSEPDLQSTVTILYMAVPDLQAHLEQMQGELAVDPYLYSYYFVCEFDTDASYERQLAFNEVLNEELSNMAQDELLSGYSYSSWAEDRAYLYATYGGLCFLGIVLSAVFLSAAVLIIYYKQITEGYEDQARFSIMQDVGMTDREIRRSINSQMLTVFFLPLFTALSHLLFAFPMISKLLQLFLTFETKTLLYATGICFLSAALLYVLIYRITSNAYYTIVRSGN